MIYLTLTLALTIALKLNLTLILPVTPPQGLRGAFDSRKIRLGYVLGSGRDEGGGGNLVVCFWLCGSLKLVFLWGCLVV